MSNENTAEAVSLDDVLEFDDLENAEVETDEVEQPEVEQEVEQAEQAEPEVPEYSPLEAPEFWGPEHKEIFTKLQAIEHAEAQEIARQAAQSWHDQWKNDQKYITQKSQTLAEEKRQYEQQLQEYNQVQKALEPIRDIWASQGVAAPIGIAQMAYWGKLLHTDPKALITEVANYSGLDLNQVVEDQPYIDPHIQQELGSLKQQNQQLQQAIGGFQQGQQQQQQNQAIFQQVAAFEQDVDDNGQLKHPYVEEVAKDMVDLLFIQNNGINTLEDAYQRAVQFNPDIQAKLQAEQEKEKAKARQAQAQKAKEAATRTNSKTKDAPKRTPKTINGIFDDFTLE